MRFVLRVRRDAGLAEFTDRLWSAGVLLEGDGSDGEWIIQAKSPEEARAWVSRMPQLNVDIEQIEQS